MSSFSWALCIICPLYFSYFRLHLKKVCCIRGASILGQIYCIRNIYPTLILGPAIISHETQYQCKISITKILLSVASRPTHKSQKEIIMFFSSNQVWLGRSAQLNSIPILQLWQLCWKIVWGNRSTVRKDKRALCVFS